MLKWKNKPKNSLIFQTASDKSDSFAGIDLTEDMMYSDSNTNRELKIIKESEDAFVHQLISTNKDFSVSKPKKNNVPHLPALRKLDKAFGYDNFLFFFTGYIDDVLYKQEIAGMEVGLRCQCCGVRIEECVTPWDMILHPEYGALCPACNEHLEISVGRHCDADGARYDWFTNSFTKDKEYDAVSTTAEAIMSRSNNYIIQLSAAYKPKDSTTRYNPSWWVDM